MGVAMFYHLTRSAPVEAARPILARAVAQGWRVMLRGTDADRLAALDRALWDPPDSFLPHGLAGGAQDALQPVLLGTGAAANAARGVMLVDGAEPLPGETALERLWVLFDGGDEAAVAAARRLWTGLTGAGMAAQYWSEDGGRWQMKTERKAAGPPAGAEAGPHASQGAG